MYHPKVNDLVIFTTHNRRIIESHLGSECYETLKEKFEGKVWAIKNIICDVEYYKERKYYFISMVHGEYITSITSDLFKKVGERSVY